MFKDKKLLVTGGTGSIGNSICSYFKKNGCEEIISLDLSDDEMIKFSDSAEAVRRMNLALK